MILKLSKSIARKARNLTSLQYRALSDVKTVGVIGMGLMGHGIAQLSSEKFQVVACDINKDSLDKGMKHIEKSLAKIYSKRDPDNVEKLTKEHMKRITPVSDLAATKDCDIVIEAIIEDLEIKKKFYAQLSGIVKKNAILASNTSSFPIQELAEASGDLASRVVGLHFFNPVQMMKLVEVIKTESTDQGVYDTTKAFITDIKRTPVECKDTPGFIVNRLLVPFLSQSIALLERGDASKEDIDTAMKLGAGHPMGPITLADFVGLDTCLAILKGWQASYPDNPDFVIPKLLEQKVSEGKFGRKSGEGFYKW